MTSNNAVNKEQTEFIYLNYPKHDFLINKCEILSSNFINGQEAILSGLKYITDVISYQDSKILLLNLSDFLEEEFHLEKSEGSFLVLIYPLENLSEKFRGRISASIKSKGLKGIINTDYFALKVSSSIERTALDVSEIRLMPVRLLKKCFYSGMAGIRFIDGQSRIQYWLSLENIITRYLLTARKDLAA